MKSLLSRLSGLLLVAVVAVSGLSLASEAQAGGYFGRHYGYWQICYETQYVPYTVCEYSYDHCGYSYPVYRTYYKTVVIPIRKWVY